MSFLLNAPRRVVAYWFLVAVAAAITAVLPVLLNLTAEISAERVLEAGLLAVAGVALGRFQIRLSTSMARETANTTVHSVAAVATVLLLPFPWVFLVAVGSLVAACLLQRMPWYKVVFNSCSGALSTAFARVIWQFAGQDASIGTTESAPWLVASVLGYLAVNTLLVATIVALQSGSSVRHTWWGSLRPVLVQELGLAFLGVVVAWIWLTAPILLAAIAVPLIALHFSLDDRVMLEGLTLRLLFRVTDMLEARDRYTHGHSQRVGVYARQLAEALGLPPQRVELVFLGGRLHDIGKCGVADAVLFKPGPLDERERGHMMLHPMIGYRVLSLFKAFPQVAAAVRGHHERWDGDGYPDGLQGEAIPLEARLIAVADAYDAMTTTRPYRVGLDHDEAVRRLREGAGSQWDPRLVEPFIQMLDEDPERRHPVIDEPLLLDAGDERAARSSVAASAQPA